ncbi:MAG: hypothetical protein JST00_39215 [Deltaproteobacteria bacterium]|nr:hypothetical protein [Deltaproteobacteria bacterium]
MTRAILTALLLTTGLVFVSPGCSDEGVGDPCTPEQEYNASFLGFSEKEVNVESKSFQCRTRVCLVNHFRGRASCPYGQTADATSPGGSAKPCVVPGTQTVVSGKDDKGNFVDAQKRASVPAQCKDRNKDKAVYCSCRCADINGQKPSDQVFCDCPDGFTCSQLVTSIGGGTNEGLTGSYCIKSGTEFDADTACNQGDCSASANAGAGDCQF